MKNEMNIEKLEENILDEIKTTYEKKFGDKALYEAVKDQKSKYSHFGKDDYIDITYYENEEVRHLLLVGDILKYGDYIIAKINSNSKISIIKRIDGKYYPLEMIDEGEFL